MKGFKVIEVAEYARKKSGVVIIVHQNIPFHSFSEDVICGISFDAIETYKAIPPFSPRLIRRNVAFAKKLRFPQIWGVTIICVKPSETCTPLLMSIQEPSKISLRPYALVMLGLLEDLFNSMTDQLSQ
jgi:hypothetical protein